MKKNTLRKLGYYQLVGIVASMTIITIWAFKEGGLMTLYVLFAGLLFFPFSIVAIYSLLDKDENRRTIQGAIWAATFLLIAISYSLPFFYEWGGFLVALICTAMGIILWLNRHEIDKQISIFNIIGSGITSVILIYLIMAGIG